jgi:hypothetical protein
MPPHEEGTTGEAEPWGGAETQHVSILEAVYDTPIVLPRRRTPLRDPIGLLPTLAVAAPAPPAVPSVVVVRSVVEEVV